MKHLYQSAAVFTLCLLASLAAIPASLRAATITVTSAADDGAGTLRAALAIAANGDTINFSLPTPATIAPTSGELLITRNVTIAGPAAVGFASGDIFNRVFHINANTTVTLSSLTITGAGSGVTRSGIYNDSATLTVSNCVISGISGGGIDNEASSGNANLTLINSTVSGNFAQFGGGIYNYASSGSANVTLLNSTVSGNSAPFGGGIVNLSEGGTATLIIHSSTISGNSGQFAGGIWNVAQGGRASATILNGTVSDNSAIYDAGGIWNEAEGAGSSADLQIDNSTFSGNSASDIGGGIWNYFDTGGSATVKIGSTILDSGESGGNLANESGAIFTSDGYNLSNDDGGGVLTDATDLTNTNPVLGPLQDNGGPTFTHALSAFSPAIDHGKNFNGLAFDQRNAEFVRIFDDPGVQNPTDGDGTDIGAIETQHLLDTTPPSLTCPSNLTVEFTDNNGKVVNYSVLATDTFDAAPEVVSAPPSGSLFPIGITIVQCTAQDASGNTTSGSFSVTVLGAKGTHENVLADLMNFRTTVSERGDGKKLAAATEHLGKSSDSGLWANQTHLQSRPGKKVFQEDKEAARRLHGLINGKKSNLPDAVLQGFIDRIIRADRLLASVAIQDAITAGVSSKKIEQIQRYLVKGDAETDDADYGKGIRDYGNAWKLAIQMKIAPHTR